ncbi:hypothetical protein ACSDR0_23045 [Streptosporangium sp. G11]|uniref:hypothetical protein n=1 Tax=Streptosporangium sp. G11 TaxID=3436926 RepID=UPI003EBAF402
MRRSRCPRWCRQALGALLLRDYEPDDATDEFDTLPPDADEERRERLARRIAPQTLALIEKHPAPPQITEQATSGQKAAAGTVIEALLDLYNPAQLDVLVRVWRSTGLI